MWAGELQYFKFIWLFLKQELTLRCIFCETCCFPPYSSIFRNLWLKHEWLLITEWIKLNNAFFDTMSEVCELLSETMQKFDDDVNFLPHPQEKMDFHWSGQKIDIV